MQYQLLAVLAAAVTASAQSLAGNLASLSKCAVAPLVSVVTDAGCDESDRQCICNQRSKLDGTVKDACSSDDQAKFGSFADTFCAAGDAAPASDMTTSMTATTTAKTDMSSTDSLTTITNAGSATTGSILVTDTSMSPEPTSSLSPMDMETTSAPISSPSNYSMTSTSATGVQAATGGAEGSKMSWAALCIAVGSLSWLFAEF